MKTLLKSAIIAFALFFGHLFHGKAQSSLAMNVSKKLAAEKTYHIGKNSILKLEGKTNVSGFTCDCNDNFPPQQFIVEGTNDGSLNTEFKLASLKLKIKSLDCGNALMNKDLQKALNASTYPNITIELKKVEQAKCNRLTELKDWVQMKALIRITLNNVSKEYWLNITAKKSGPNQFRFIGSKSLKMTDFCVTPPVAMMGMIKVQDAITINLDLEVTVE